MTHAHTRRLYYWTRHLRWKSWLEVESLWCDTHPFYCRRPKKTKVKA